MKSRSQQFLDAMEAKDASLLPRPITREDRFYQSLVTRDTTDLVPTTDKERYLLAAESFLGTGGGGESISVPRKITWDAGLPLIPYIYPENNVALEYAAPYSDTTGLPPDEYSVFINNKIGFPGTLYSSFYAWSIELDVSSLSSLVIPTKGSDLSEEFGHIRIAIDGSVVFETSTNHNWTEQVIDVSLLSGVVFIAVGMYQADSRTDKDRGIYIGNVRTIK